MDHTSVSCVLVILDVGCPPNLDGARRKDLLAAGRCLVALATRDLQSCTSTTPSHQIYTGAPVSMW
eukprot:CAMPEP_0182819150 /NCGR_PEP_ID=MMETSP0006_2-20121128/12419_1 /TAXON_ID=97485 /ORGANISM="Prymnesium parvum, Strain Texoma1" /LENGTH=65 /DNA_ID=CAMNT_0024945693 /DNA_START=265 /DNA_END=459 /DNA_ORIENTATION=-